MKIINNLKLIKLKINTNNIFKHKIIFYKKNILINNKLSLKNLQILYQYSDFKRNNRFLKI